MANSTPRKQGVDWGAFGLNVAAFLGPLIVLLVGIVLKFTFIDHPPPADLTGDSFKDNYAKGIWLQLLLVSYVTAIWWYFANGNNVANVTWLLLVPTLGICSVLVLATTKLNVAHEASTIWIPSFIGVASSGVSGVLSRE